MGEEGKPSRGLGRRIGGRTGTQAYTPPPRRAMPTLRAARAHGARPPLMGYLCERCLDAPALGGQPAPWGGEMGVCAACQETLADDAGPHARASSEAPPAVG